MTVASLTLSEGGRISDHRRKQAAEFYSDQRLRSRLGRWEVLALMADPIGSHRPTLDLPWPVKGANGPVYARRPAFGPFGPMGWERVAVKCAELGWTPSA